MLKTSVETITPKLAAEYLKKHNTHNYRPLRRSVYKPYAEDMRNNRWELNGEPIVFSLDGTLKDGQHRLAAIVESGKTIEMVVVRDVADDVQIYNVGLRRTMPQIVNAMNIDCNATVASAANIIVNKFSRTRQNGMTPKYISEHIDELNRAYRVTTYGHKNVSKNAASIAAAYLVLRTNVIPMYEVELFFRLFNEWGCTSADGYEITPAVIARKMFDDRESKCGYQIQKERMEILILAMNDFHQNRKRETKYKISEPFRFTELMDKVRKADGLED